jgi:hypothetical protein
MQQGASSMALKVSRAASSTTRTNLPRNKPLGHISKVRGTMCAVVNCDEFEKEDIAETLANLKTNLIVCTGIPCGTLARLGSVRHGIPRRRGAPSAPIAYFLVYTHNARAWLSKPVPCATQRDHAIR